LTRGAERSIDLQYYLFHEDISGRLLALKLLEAADRGVRVRLLLDDIDTVGKDEHLAILDAHPNIEVRLFNPFVMRENRYAEYVTRFGEVTRRMHNKSFIIDNQVAIVGGRNIGDEYFERNREFSFGDMDLMAIGPVVSDVAHAFDLYWNNKLSVSVSVVTNKANRRSLIRMRKQLQADAKKQRLSEYQDRVEKSNLFAQLHDKNLNFYWGEGRVLYDHPDKLLSEENDTSSYLLPALKTAIQDIHSELLIISPYFVPTAGGVRIFRQLVESGVKFKILTNSLAANDVPAVHAGYRRYRIALLQAGVELYELKPIPNGKGGGSGFSGSSRASLHAKSMVIDQKRIFVGSFNLDPRSIHINTEMGILVDSERLARDFSTWLNQNLPEISYRLALTESSTTDGDAIAMEPEVHWLEHKNGKIVVHDDEPEASLWRRLQVFFYSLLPIEDQL